MVVNEGGKAVEDSWQAEVVGVAGVVGAAVSGFRQEMAADGFASLAREDAGMNVVFLRRGLEALPAGQRDKHAAGLILAFAVDDLEGELARLRAEEVAITMPLTVEERGQRAFQVTDPNGVIIELLDWAARPAGQQPSGQELVIQTGAA